MLCKNRCVLSAVIQTDLSFGLCYVWANKYQPRDKKTWKHYKSYCSTVHFCRITSNYQPTNAHIISHKTLLKHFKTLRHVSILSDHNQGALFLAKFMLQYTQFNSYLQTRCCGSISCCVGMYCGAVARCASRVKHTEHSIVFYT